MGYWWNEIDRGTEVLGDNSVLLLHCSPQIPYRLPWDRTLKETENSATNHLSYGTAWVVFLFLENVLTNFEI
jgi:hypothetical protein